jgi:hypothetical protein
MMIKWEEWRESCYSLMVFMTLGMNPSRVMTRTTRKVHRNGAKTKVKR